MRSGGNVTGKSQQFQNAGSMKREIDAALRVLDSISEPPPDVRNATVALARVSKNLTANMSDKQRAEMVDIIGVHTTRIREQVKDLQALAAVIPYPTGSYGDILSCIRSLQEGAGVLTWAVFRLTNANI